jgi:hypothetical protein
MGLFSACGWGRSGVLTTCLVPIHLQLRVQGAEQRLHLAGGVLVTVLCLCCSVLAHTCWLLPQHGLSTCAWSTRKDIVHDHAHRIPHGFCALIRRLVCHKHISSTTPYLGTWKGWAWCWQFTMQGPPSACCISCCLNSRCTYPYV